MGKTMKKSFVILLLLFSLIQSASSYEFWVPTGSLPESIVTSIVVNKTTGTIFAGLEGDGVYRSDNEGVTWTVINNGLSSKLVKALAINSKGEIFAGTNGAGVFKSVNNGNDWVEMNTDLTNKNILCLNMDKDDNLLAGAWFYGAVYRLKKDAAKWEKLGVNDFDVHSVFTAQNTYLYAGTQVNGSYRSVDNGTTWAATGDFYGKTTYAFAQSANMIIAGVTDGIYVSNDNGGTWTLKSNGIDNPQIRSLVVVNNGYIFAGTLNGGVYRSKDNCNSWEKVNSGFTLPVTVLSMGITNNSVLYSATSGNGVWKSVRPVDKSYFVISVSAQDSMLVHRDVNYTINAYAYDEYDKPMVDVAITLKSQSLGIDQGGMTNSEGLFAFILEINSSIQNGYYSYSINGTKSGYESFGEIKQYVNVDDFHLLLMVNPSTQTVMRGATAQFGISVLQDNDVPVPNASVHIKDNILGNETDLTTDANGYITYESLVPLGFQPGDYTIEFSAKNPGMKDSEKITRLVTVDTATVSVFEAPVNNNIEIISQNGKVVFITNSLSTVPYELKLFDLSGRLLSSRSYPAGTNPEFDIRNFSSGIMFYQISNSVSLLSGILLIE
jgi:hypothetical protein